MVFLKPKKIFTTGAYDAVFVVVVGSLVANGVFYIIYGDAVLVHLHLLASKENVGSDRGRELSRQQQAEPGDAWAIWYLSMELKRKIEVFAIFGVGAIMAEIAAVIIADCCPYVPRFLHCIKLRGAGGDTAKRSFSIPPKPTGKLNTLAKYLSPRSELSNLGPPTSEECLEMHQYEIDVSHSPSSVADDSVMVE
ncbi:hypothetical protein EJ07DRAFT_157177 [Lizonia empirigonia]|nr:hypothetical protein EJ07DRAFT_157177 [Lizonia empirigonia]